MENSSPIAKPPLKNRNWLGKTGLWLKANRDIVQAYLLFISATVVGFGVVLADWASGYVLDPLNNWTAAASGVIINIFGGDATVSGVNISSHLGAVSIAEGCNAVYATIIFLAAVLAFPTSWKNRLIGAVFGIIALFFINLIRIVTLFYLSGYDAKLFEEAHLHIWQFAIILIGGLLWLLWYDRIVKRPSRSAHL